MSEILHHRAKIAALSRSRKPDDPELLVEKKRLAQAKTNARIEALIADAPPLSDEQRTRLAELLKPVRKKTAPAPPPTPSVNAVAVRRRTKSYEKSPPGSTPASRMGGSTAPGSAELNPSGGGA